MKTISTFILVIFSIFYFISSTLSAKDDFPVLKGPYLGQKPPGMTPEIFAPGIISTGHSESHPFFTPDGKELYYMLWGAPYNVILHMEEEKNSWTKPKIASFFKKYDEKLCLSPDGKTIVFGSHRHRLEEGEERHKKPAPIWILKRTETGWSKAQKLRDPINGPVAISGSGHLYFSTPFNGGMGGDDICFSRYVNGDYAEPENMGASINTSRHECDPCISPDESFLIFCRKGEGFGRHDLFISFRKDDDSWTKAINIGEPINSSASELCPVFSPDGKYLFFTSNRRLHESYSKIPLTYERKLKILNGPGNGSADIYWVDTKIIEQLKAKELK
jgi:Tol biopolymer transport system component